MDVGYEIEERKKEKRADRLALRAPCWCAFWRAVLGHSVGTSQLAAWMEFASRATLAATTLIVLTLLLHRLESPLPPPSPSQGVPSPAASLAPPLRTEPTTLQQQPAALPSAGNGTAMQFWHVTDWHLNLFHRADGDVRDMCRSATGDPAHWPGPYATEGSNPELADPGQVSYSNV